jgi:hypothetical protein
MLPPGTPAPTIGLRSENYETVRDLIRSVPTWGSDRPESRAFSSLFTFEDAPAAFSSKANKSRLTPVRITTSPTKVLMAHGEPRNFQRMLYK